MRGTIVGGWEYVWFAYGLTSAVLLFYGISLVTRLRKERQHDQH